MKKLSQQIEVNKDSLSLWERAAMELEAMQNAGFKKEMVHSYCQFAAGIKHELDAMNAQVKASDLHKTMTL